jgi:hypothetical protein
MIARIMGSLGKISFGLIIFVIELFYFLLFARLDPEGHHDGVMLAAAIGVSEGGIPNRDVFTQYGPLTPLIQGFWIFLTEPTLLSLRILTSIQLALCGALLFWILRVILSQQLAAAVSVAWSLSYPFFILPIALPWASVLTTLITLTTMILLLNISQSKNSSIKYFIATILLAVGIFARIHMILPLGVLGVYALWQMAERREEKFLKAWVMATATTITIITAMLYRSNALDEYLNQCILWAFSNYATPAVGLTKGEIVAMALMLLFPGFLFLLWCQLRVEKLRVSNTLKILIYSTAILSIILLSNISVQHKSYLNPKYIAVSLSQNYPNIIAYSAVTMLPILLWKKRRKFAFLRLEVLPVAVGAATLPQLYPAHDTLHLYWIAPAVIAAVALAMQQSDPTGMAQKSKQIIPTVVSVIIIGLVLSSLHLAKTRASYRDPVLQGMVGEEATRKPIDEMLLSLRKLPQESTIEFNCAHGLFAVAGGKYLASDLRFVSWGTKPISKLDYEYKLSCDLTEIEAKKLREMENIVSEVRLATGQFIQLSKN